MRHTAHLTADPSLKVRSRTTGEVARRVLRYLRPYPGLALGTIACAVMAQVFALTYPKLTQLVIDEVIDRGRADFLIPVVGGLLGAFVLRDVFNSLRIRLNNQFEQGVVYDLRREVYGRLQRLPAGWFDQRSTGDLMTRVIEDVNAVERLVIDGTEQGVVSVLGLVAVATLLFQSHAGLAGLAMVPLPLLAGGAMWYTRTAHKRYRARSQASAAMNALLMDNLQGVRQVKSFGREEHEDARFAARADDLRRGTLRVMRAWAWYNPAMSLAAALGTVLVLWQGGRLVLGGELTKGELVGFLLYLGMFYQPISQLHGLNQMAQAARAAGERVFDILDAEPEAAADVGVGGGLERVRGEVEFEDVRVRYPGGGEVLHGVTLRARPGEMVALVGPTGAGKTTLVSVLPRFYETSGGVIRVDGRDIRELPLAALRRHIAVVTQEPFLFNGTIRENLLYGRLEAGDEDVEKAARAANCHDFISRLPDGDTWTTEPVRSSKGR